MRVDTDVLLDLLPDLVVVMGDDGIVTYVNGAMSRVLGWAPHEVLGRSAFDFVHPDEQAEAVTEIATQLADGTTTVRHHTRLAHRDGHYVKFELLAATTPGDRDLYLVMRDITEREQHQMLLHQSDEQLRALTDNVPDAVGRFDAAARLVFSSRRFQEVADAHPGLIDSWTRHARTVLATGDRTEVEQVLGDREGWIAARFVPEVTADGDVTHVLVIATDVTHRKENELRLIRAASHDPLTGLLNRQRFREAAERALSRADEVGALSLIFIDLDEFKIVNDVHGHQVGDTVLATVGRRLADVVRPQDLVARFGGDEFVMLCLGLGEDDAAAVGARVVEVLAEPIALVAHDTKVVVGASIGVATTTEPSTAFDDLLHRADLAMYRAKAVAQP